MQVRDHKALAISIAARYFKFLLHGELRQDTLAVCEAAHAYCDRMSLQESSRLIQRLLYRLARDAGWYKDTRDKFRWKKRR